SRAQLRLLDLAHAVAGNLVDEADGLRHFEAREALAAVREELVLGRVAIDDDEGDPDLAPAIVRDADDGAVPHGPVLVEDGLDLGRIDVLAARDEHVLEAALDPVAAVLSHLRDVAGAQPAVGGEGLPRRRLVSPVAREDVRALAEQLAVRGEAG